MLLWQIERRRHQAEVKRRLGKLANRRQIGLGAVLSALGIILLAQTTPKPHPQDHSPLRGKARLSERRKVLRPWGDYA